ncbi:MAG: hypothetical protein QM758_28790 [Armatimonas sp.]
MRFHLAPVAAVCATFVVASSAAHAHFIWGMIDNGEARFALLEEPSQKPDVRFEKYVASLKTSLTMGIPKDGACSARLSPTQKTAFASSIVGVKERQGATYLLDYQAKAAADLASAGTPSKDAKTEVLARKEGDSLQVIVLQGGWPVPDTEVTVHWPGAPEVTGTTDLAGQIKFEWSKAAKPGYLGVRARVVEGVPGVNDGKKYEEIHHWTSLTAPIAAPLTATAQELTPAVAISPAPPAPTAQAPSGPETFSRTLRNSFGNNHEAVSGAAFNVTLFAGKLTRPQLIAHLQQRALVHNEVHRILIGAAPTLNVPYGADQKHVLTYLFADLVEMGSGWPTEAQAFPVTSAFLQEIRDSEKKGPYFALGVQHVYFGGITNGGRMIGQKISETLTVPLSYYSKSDGYRDYLLKVDEIKDPAARAEMIRGGQAAYKYIAASMNEAIFKSDAPAAEKS